MHELKIAYFTHALRSDWNNGNAHFLRGLMRAMVSLGHDVTVWEPEHGWSIENLRDEPDGLQSIEAFQDTYPDIHVNSYAHDEDPELWRERLRNKHIVIIHEWNPPLLVKAILDLRKELGFRVLFHDTHHRAFSKPQQMQLFELGRFDGVLAFGKVLRDIYRNNFHLSRVWILHEAADTTVFHPQPSVRKDVDGVWIGNWGDGERSHEICEFFLKPACALADRAKFVIYGVRYPQGGLRALKQAKVHYGGYLSNLHAPDVYSKARFTVHIPRRQYASTMMGIPTIRVFEALACGIPLICAPWQDTEGLFHHNEWVCVSTAAEMISAMKTLLDHPDKAAAQSKRGLETILARHTCRHRAYELTKICEEVL